MKCIYQKKKHCEMKKIHTQAHCLGGSQLDNGREGEGNSRRRKGGDGERIRGVVLFRDKSPNFWKRPGAQHSVAPKYKGLRSHTSPQ